LRAIVLGDAASLRLSNPAKATIANVPNILTLLEPENSLVAGAPAALVLHRLVLTDTAAAQTYHLTRNATVRNSYDLIAGLPPPFNPRALSADDFLAYALIPGPDAEVPQTGGGLSHLPAVRLAGGDLSMTFRPARAGFTYQPQKSTDLRTWENLFAPVTPSVPGAPPVTIEAPADSPRQFLRLKITAPNE
ncbi:MAG: hypothetical protein LBR12_05790, partial [Opitutaceae bacterium]|nr:hypothetical protein [Opitutaceae bacterium]